MHKKDIIKKFRKFLEENYVLEKFIMYSKSGTGLHVYHNPFYWMNNISSKDYIVHAFSWKNTEEGYYFWETLSQKWSTLCRLNNIELHE